LSAPDSLLPVLIDTAANVQAVWSPDRSRIAFSSSHSGVHQLEVMDADGSNRRVLSASVGVDGEPAWSPDGRRVAFASSRGGAAQLFLVDADGGEPRQLTRLQVPAPRRPGRRTAARSRSSPHAMAATTST
jgi:Periplasmic component of the Tol biopolymer transport system